MKIAIIGAGNVGGTLGKRWAAKGHQIFFGTREPQSPKIRTLLQSMGSNAKAVNVNEAAPSAEVVVVGIGMFAHSPALAFAALFVAVTGSLAYNGPFWQIPPMLLAGTAAAGGIALINSLGSLSGWVGPSIVGWLKDLTGKTSTGLYVVAGLEVLGSALILLFMPRRAVTTSGKQPR